MIELERHIEILLLSNDCVIVPDLGGFMAYHVEARYDEEDRTFLPPLRTLGFNPQLKMNDSLLVQSYIEAYDLSYPEALRRIESEVTELKQHLDNEGAYELNDIGTLQVTDDGRLVFNPCEAGILTPELYGLSSFEMSPIARRDNKSQVAQASEESQPTAKDITKTNIATTGNETVYETDGERTVTIKMSWVHNALAAAAALLALFLLTTPVGDGDTATRCMSNLNNPFIVGMLPKDTNMEKIDIKKEDIPAVSNAETIAQEDTVEHQTLADSLQQNEPTTGGYSIVLASYVTKKNAQSFVDKLQREGHTEAEVFVRNNVTRVVLGHFETENDAYNKLRTLRGSPDFEEAWVMKLAN